MHRTIDRPEFGHPGRYIMSPLPQKSKHYLLLKFLTKSQKVTAKSQELITIQQSVFMPAVLIETTNYTDEMDFILDTENTEIEGI
ncbi:MAG: hypothetical protein KAS19_00540 [Anaerolineales bacterium]|nr:hypothetical protein [Anaerolineales bacterium]